MKQEESDNSKTTPNKTWFKMQTYRAMDSMVRHRLEKR